MDSFDPIIVLEHEAIIGGSPPNQLPQASEPGRAFRV
jgi:hypothetical protein